MPATILLVEDDPIVRMLISFVIRDLGATAIETYSAEHALDILESREDIDILLTDVVMPGELDGFALMDMVHRRWPKIRLVVVSGQIAAADLPQDRFFMAKPIREADLKHVLKTIGAVH